MVNASEETGDHRENDLSESQRRSLARKQAEGKSRREALRCLKRHLARRVWQLLRTPSDQDQRSNNDTTTNNTQPPITGNAPYFMPCAR